MLAARVIERELLVYRRLWRASAVTQFLAPLLFLLAIGLGLGGLVDERSGEVEGLSYLVFVTPGVLAAGAMQSAAGESLWPVLGGMKWMRHFHGMVSTPLSPADVLGGRLVWTAARIAVSSTIFVSVGAALGGVPSAWGVLAVPSAVLCGLAFAAPLSAFSATQQTDFAFPVVIRLGIVPLFLFSATFFPLDQLPAGLRPLAVASPLWHGVELTRGATTGTLEVLPAAGHVLVLLAFLAVGYLVGCRTFTRRLSA